MSSKRHKDCLKQKNFAANIFIMGNSKYIYIKKFSGSVALKKKKSIYICTKKQMFFENMGANGIDWQGQLYGARSQTSSMT